MGSDVLKKFGRYFLLDQIAQGGMAEIYRARLAAVDGAGRLIVIKRIQAGYGSNQEFLQMFKSEIKVTMAFNHPNIVQLYDFGEENNQPYIAMEIVDGKNLRQFLSRFAELKQTFPVDLAAHIVEQAAGGLHYAHCFKDKISGEPLNIVHRDISPQNILISYEGNVKIIDFGIAKATTNSESTRAGVIKGKPAYLSPEQISGEVLDGRCDLFALGVVLWELLTGRKLFAGENDLAVLKLIESCNTHVKPPSTINPKVPKELDYIVLKMLAKQRDKRYLNGEELQRALHKFLYSFNPDFNPGDLAYYAKDLFKNEIVEDRKRIQKLNEKAEQLLAMDIPDAPKTEDTKSQETKKEDTTTVVEKKPKPTPPSSVALDPLSAKKNVRLEIEPTPALRGSMRTTGTGVSPRGSVSRPSAPKQTAKKGGGMFKTLFLLLIAGGVGVTFFGPELGVNIPGVTDVVNEWVGGGEAKLVLQGNAKNVSVLVNGQAMASALPATIRGIPVGTSFQVVVTGPSGTFQQEVILRKGEKKELPVVWPVERPIATDAATKTILLRLNVTPGGGGASISVNGRALDPNNLFAQVPLDAPLELVAERPGFKSIRREFVLESRQLNGLKEWLMDIPMEPMHFGYLTIRTTPSAKAVIMIDGKPWVKQTPLENEKVPVGSYRIKLTNEVLGMEKTVSVTIQEGTAINLDERLEIKN